jgi:hypothetical protein
MKRLAVVLIMAAGAPPALAQYRAPPPQQTVTSHIGLMNELQKRGPYAYAHGPYAGGEYVVVGPLGPPPPPRRHRRSRNYR